MGALCASVPEIGVNWPRFEAVVPFLIPHIPTPGNLVAPEWHTSQYGRQAPRVELNIFTIIHLSWVTRRCTQRLCPVNRCKLGPIWSPGPLPHIPTPGNPVAPEWHTSQYGRQTPRLELNISTIIHLFGQLKVCTLRLGSGNRRKLAPIWSPGPLPHIPTPGNPVAPEWHTSQYGCYAMLFMHRVRISLILLSD